MVWRVAVVVAVVTALTVGCSSHTGPSLPAGVSVSSHVPFALRVAIIRTLEVGSARAETTFGPNIISTIYQAPDRVMVVQITTQASNSLNIGGIALVTTYVGDQVYTQFGPVAATVTTRPPKPRVSGHLVALNEVFQDVLMVAHAAKVTGGGDTYQFATALDPGARRSPDDAETGTVHLRGGMIVGIDEATLPTSPSGTEHRVTTFSDFGTAPAVVAPPTGGAPSSGTAIVSVPTAQTSAPVHCGPTGYLALIGDWNGSAGGPFGVLTITNISHSTCLLRGGSPKISFHNADGATISAGGGPPSASSPAELTLAPGMTVGTHVDLGDPTKITGFVCTPYDVGFVDVETPDGMGLGEVPGFGICSNKPEVYVEDLAPISTLLFPGSP